LDIYSNTEGGVIATQTWDYQGMTFIPNLNFLEFIPEKEHLKWSADHQYTPRTLLLDELEEGQCYEIVITNFHGGALVRYRIGDMIRITALANEVTGIKLPQMVFERRCDDLIDFNIIRLTEKSIWQALEQTGITYEDWVAFKTPGEMSLTLMIEPRGNLSKNKGELEKTIMNAILKSTDDSFSTSRVHKDVLEMIPIELNLTLLPKGSFSAYIAHKRAEGADMAHLKPPHINPQAKVIAMLMGRFDTKLEDRVVPQVKIPAASARR
jgi:phenylacetate-coenzyme A ligase PaaK-like adenylate-forming protein